MEAFENKKYTMIPRLCILCIIMSCIDAQYRLSVDVQPQSVREGDTLTVKCKVNKTTSTAGEMEIVWVRRMAGERNLDSAQSERVELREIEMGRNSTILDDFKKSGRYSASQEYQDFYQIYILKISDLKSIDSGEIGCRLLNNHIEIFKPVVVHKFPAKINLMSKNLGNDQATSYEDKERVEFTEMEKRNFQCYVGEVYPEPRVRILLNKQDISHVFNKSQRLTRTLANEDIVSFGELSALHYDLYMTSYGLEFNYEFDNKSIQCVVDFPESGMESMHSSVQVFLKGYTPKFLCNNDYPIALHHPNFEIQCKILGHPKASSARVHWKRHTTGNMSISSGEKYGAYGARLIDSQLKNEGRAKILTFRIDHIFPQHFRQYNFEATNAIGTSTFTVNVHQIGKSRLFNTGISTPPVLTWYSSMTSIFILVFLFR